MLLDDYVGYGARTPGYRKVNSMAKKKAGPAPTKKKYRGVLTAIYDSEIEEEGFYVDGVLVQTEPFCCDEAAYEMAKLLGFKVEKKEACTSQWPKTLKEFKKKLVDLK